MAERDACTLKPRQHRDESQRLRARRAGQSRVTGPGYPWSLPESSDLMRDVLTWSRRASAHATLLAACCLFAAWLLLNLREQWFVLDEFDYHRPNPGQTYLEWLVAPHNEHTIIFTKLWYSGLYEVVGLDHYWLYAVSLVAGHLTLVAGVHRLLSRATGSAWFATVGALPVLAMGAAYGTLTWAGQGQYTWPVALGVWSIALAAGPRSRSLSVWLLAALAVVGTFGGSAFLPYGVVSGLALLWFRRFGRGLLMAGVPAGWFLLERALWELPSTYAAESVEQVLRRGPKFGWAILDKAISDTLLVEGFGPVVLAFLLWGAASVLRRRPATTLDEGRHWAVVLLLGAELVTVAALVVARLNYGTGPNGGHSYLVLAPLLPLAALVVAPMVLGAPVGFRLAMAGVCVCLAAMAVATIDSYSRDLAAYGQQSRATLSAAADLALDPAFEAVDDDLAPSAAAPSFTWGEVRQAARDGVLRRSSPDEATRDAVSLAVQWAAERTSLPVSGCVQESGPVVVAPGSVIAADATAVTLRYPGTEATRVLTTAPGTAYRLESNTGRAVEVSVAPRIALTVCPSVPVETGPVGQAAQQAG